MRVALISDVHGCLTALDAVLADLRDEAVDTVASLGDIAAAGPSPAQAIERTAEACRISVVGNTDEGMLDPPDWWSDPASIGIPEEAHPDIEQSLWAAGQIGDEHRRYLSELPATASTSMTAAISLLAFHGSPRDPNDYFTADSDQDELERIFDGVTETVLAGGHTHVQMVRRLGKRTVINAGSAGMPFAHYGFGGRVPVLDHAAYAIVTAEHDRHSIDLRQIPVDNDALVAEVRASDMPRGDWWLALRGIEPSVRYP